MKVELTDSFLPLGSLLRLKEVENEERLYMIVARAIAKSDEDTIISRYRVVVHPYGNVSTQELVTIHSGQIVEVLFKGYEDEADKRFLEELVERMTNASAVKKATEEVEETVEVEPVNVEEVVEDPFYKFRE